MQDLETENCLLCNQKENADDKVTKLTEQVVGLKETIMTMSSAEQGVCFDGALFES